MEMTPEQVAAVVSVRGADDPLDLRIILSTRPFLENRMGDKFLRAAIDKSTGQVGYQLYLIAVSKSAPRLRRVNFLVGGEATSSDVDRIDYDVSCSRTSCTHYEHGIASLPPEAMAEFASCSRPGEDSTFRMKVFGDTVEGDSIEMFCTEAAGLMVAADRELAKLAGD